MEPIKCNCHIYYIMTNCKKTNIIPQYDKLTERLWLYWPLWRAARRQRGHIIPGNHRLHLETVVVCSRAERNYMSGNIRPRHFIFYFFMVPSGCHSNQSCLPGTSSNSGRPHLDPRRPPPPSTPTSTPHWLQPIDCHVRGHITPNPQLNWQRFHLVRLWHCAKPTNGI